MLKVKIENKLQLAALKSQIEKQVTRQVVLSAHAIDKGAKERAKVDLGGLRSSINVHTEGTTATVTANVKYAPYVEFGTGTLVDVPAGLEAYAMQFKGKGVKKVNLPARPFLFPAFEEERKKFIEGLTVIFK